MEMPLTARSVACQRCSLLSTWRTNIVDGEGSSSPLLMGVAEGPGAGEDTTGHPFVGQSGQLLRGKTALLGLRPGDVFWTNSVRCRPPGNRNPTDEELDNCLPWLIQDIESLAPKVILALGRVAERQVAEAGKIITLPPVYYAQHPAAILRNRKKEHEWLEELKVAIAAAYGEEYQAPQLPNEPYVLHRDLNVREAQEWLRAQTCITLDTETIPPTDHSYGDVLVSYQFGNDTESWFVERWPPGDIEHVMEDAAIGFLQELFDWARDPEHDLWFHNAKYDLAVCRRAGIDV